MGHWVLSPKHPTPNETKSEKEVGAGSDDKLMEIVIGFPNRNRKIRQAIPGPVEAGCCCLAALWHSDSLFLSHSAQCEG